MTVLERTRKLTDLARIDGGSVDLDLFAERLVEVDDYLEAVAIIDRGGNVVGSFGLSPELLETLTAGETMRLVAVSDVGTLTMAGKEAVVRPVRYRQSKLGVLACFGSRLSKQGEDGIFLSEYASYLLALFMAYAKDRKRETEERELSAVRAALSALSFSETYALKSVLTELGGGEGLVVASRVADAVQLTRSVIVTALRKLESANLVRTRSLGMKGTYVKVLNPLLLEELDLAGLDEARTAPPIPSYLVRKQA